MALDLGPHDLDAQSLTAPARQERQKFNWWGFGLTPILFLCLLGMTQAWLYGWAKVQQKQVDRMRIAVERVRSQVREKSYKYAEAVSRFELRPEEESTYQRLTPDRVERISVNVELPQPTVASMTPTGKTEKLAAAVRFVQTQWIYFTHFLHTGSATAAHPAAAATLTPEQTSDDSGRSGRRG